MKANDEPAFPFESEQHPGMGLRDYFAAKATDSDIAFLIGDYSPPSIANFLGVSFESVRDDMPYATIKARVKARYILADTMLAERANP